MDLKTKGVYSEYFKDLLANCEKWVDDDFRIIMKKVIKSRKAMRGLVKLRKDRQFILAGLIGNSIREIKHYTFAKDIVSAIFRDNQSEVEKEIPRFIKGLDEFELKSYSNIIKRQTIKIAIRRMINDLGIEHRELPRDKREYKSMQEFMEALYERNFKTLGDGLKIVQRVPMAIHTFTDGDSIRSIWDKIELSVEPLPAIFGIPDNNGIRKSCVEFYSMITLMLHLTYGRGIKFDRLVKSFNQIKINNGVVTDKMIEQLENEMPEFNTIVKTKVRDNGDGKLIMDVGNNDSSHNGMIDRISSRRDSTSWDNHDDEHSSRIQKKRKLK